MRKGCRIELFVAGLIAVAIPLLLVSCKGVVVDVHNRGLATADTLCLTVQMDIPETGVFPIDGFRWGDVKPAYAHYAGKDAKGNDCWRLYFPVKVPSFATQRVSAAPTSVILPWKPEHVEWKTVSGQAWAGYAEDIFVVPDSASGSVLGASSGRTYYSELLRPRSADWLDVYYHRNLVYRDRRSSTPSVVHGVSYVETRTFWPGQSTSTGGAGATSAKGTETHPARH